MRWFRPRVPLSYSHNPYQAEAGLAATAPFLSHGLGHGLGHYHSAPGRGQPLVPELRPRPCLRRLKPCAPLTWSRHSSHSEVPADSLLCTKNFPTGSRVGEGHSSQFAEVRVTWNGHWPRTWVLGIQLLFLSPGASTSPNPCPPIAPDVFTLCSAFVFGA